MQSNITSEDIQEALKQLDRPRAIVFAAACCERILPICEPFFYKHADRSRIMLSGYLDDAWQFAVLEDKSKEYFEDSAKRCFAIAPMIDRYKPDRRHSAADAMNVVCVFYDVLKLCAGIGLPSGTLKAQSSTVHAVDSWLLENAFAVHATVKNAEILRGKSPPEIRSALVDLEGRQNAERSEYFTFRNELGRQLQDVRDLTDRKWGSSLVSSVRDRARNHPITQRFK